MFGSGLSLDNVLSGCKEEDTTFNEVIAEILKREIDYMMRIVAKGTQGEDIPWILK